MDNTNTINRLSEWAKLESSRTWNITATGEWIQISVSERGRYYSRRVVVAMMEAARFDLLDTDAEIIIKGLAADLKAKP